MPGAAGSRARENAAAVNDRCQDTPLVVAVEHSPPEDLSPRRVDSGDGIDVGDQQLWPALDHGEAGRGIGALAHFFGALSLADQAAPQALAGLLVDLDERVGSLNTDSILDDQR